MNPIRLYWFPLSGHAHRAELFLSLLRLPFERIEIDMPGGEHKSPEFLRRNPLGQVPVIEDGETTLADSNAILVYLATRYDASGRWYSADPLLRGRIQQWLSIAAGQLAAGPCVARLVKVFGLKLDYENARSIAARLFAHLDDHLSRHEFFVGRSPSLADVALYSYTAHAPEGGVPLTPYPNVRAWLTRMEILDGFVPMARSPIPD
jgi:glutathione S-transferase